MANSQAGSDDDAEEQGGVAVQESDTNVAEPPKYAVFLYNDDYTTMDFVVEVLRRFFKKTSQEALDITMKVHREGRAIAGIYNKDVAETKVMQVTEFARTNGFPLRCAAEAL